MKKIFLVRHGESEGNVQKVFQGWLDYRLTYKGIKQSEQLSRRLEKEKIDIIYSSPLKRAHKTAEIINKKHNKEIIIKNDLRELNYGKWQGLNKKNIERISPNKIEIFLNNPTKFEIPGGENYKESLTRANKIIKTISQDRSKNICIVSHGIIIKVILCVLKKESLKNMWNYKQSNTCINLIYENNMKFKIISINDTEHLYDL